MRSAGDGEVVARQAAAPTAFSSSPTLLSIPSLKHHLLFDLRKLRVLLPSTVQTTPALSPPLTPLDIYSSM